MQDYSPLPRRSQTAGLLHLDRGSVAMKPEAVPSAGRAWVARIGVTYSG